MSQFRMGDCSAVKMARSANDMYDDFCKARENQFVDFFSTVSDSEIIFTRLSNGIMAKRVRIGGTHNVEDETSFHNIFDDVGGTTMTKVDVTDHSVTYKMTFMRAGEIIKPSKKRVIVDFIMGIILLLVGTFLVYEVKTYF